jgi:hypothetical protein
MYLVSSYLISDVKETKFLFWVSVFLRNNFSSAIFFLSGAANLLYDEVNNALAGGRKRWIIEVGRLGAASGADWSGFSLAARARDVVMKAVV